MGAFFTRPMIWHKLTRLIGCSVGVLTKIGMSHKLLLPRCVLGSGLTLALGELKVALKSGEDMIGSCTDSHSYS